MLDKPRQDFIKKLSSILIGPKTSDEAILANPCDQYLYGYLWPSTHNYSVKDLSFELEDDNLESTPSKYSSNSVEDNMGTTLNESIPLGQKYKQCSIGISFQVPDNAEKIVANIKYGKYEYDPSSHNWNRKAYIFDAELHLKSARHKISEHASLDLICHKRSGIYICTATLINNSEQLYDECLLTAQEYKNEDRFNLTVISNFQEYMTIRKEMFESQIDKLKVETE